MPDEKRETRRARNARFGIKSPPVSVPPQGAHIWDWFWTLSARRTSGPEALRYAEVGEWQRITRTPIRPEEVEIIMRMDDSFLTEVRKEQADAMERQRDAANRRN